MIIDWHNLGYSILALRLGDSHPFVRIAKWCVLSIFYLALFSNDNEITGSSRISDAQRMRICSLPKP